MPVRFNPPPGWQVPPGFRPDSAWAPDPSWPPAPPGWNYWVDTPQTDVPRAAAPPHRPHPRGRRPGGRSADRHRGRGGHPHRGDPGDRRAARPSGRRTTPGRSAPAEAMGSTITMAPVSAPPGPPRPGSGPQPVYPPQPGSAPPPPPAAEPRKNPTSGVLAALKNLGGKNPATAPAAAGPGP
nr:hypothetical protein GCM10025730_33210 [Promicromonospora thailandica]